MVAPSFADLAVIAIANVANLLMAGVFVARARKYPQLARYYLGIPLLVLGVPIGWIVVANGLGGRPWWTISLPLFFLAFLALELVLDYVRRAEFRQSRLVGPYLALYYVGFMLLIGYSFLAGGSLGFVTLATYFAMLGATAYYFASGHTIERVPAAPRVAAGRRV